jgi:hypothetical protein
MERQRYETTLARPQANPALLLAEEKPMTTFKTALQFILPIVLGVYCLAQGVALVMNEDQTIQLLGGCVLLWLPGCAYYAWRGCKALLSWTAAVPATPEPTPILYPETPVELLNTGADRILSQDNKDVLQKIA